jgi:hypothetical protein
MLITSSRALTSTLPEIILRPWIAYIARIVYSKSTQIVDIVVRGGLVFELYSPRHVKIDSGSRMRSALRR